jgi:hypothetical protein
MMGRERYCASAGRLISAANFGQHGLARGSLSEI